MGIARIAGGHDAVEHIDPLRHRVNDVLRRAHAHQVARLVFRQLVAAVGDNLAHFLLRLTHRKPAQGVAVEAELN